MNHSHEFYMKKALIEADRASSEDEVLDLFPSNVFEQSDNCFLIRSGLFKR